MFIQMSINFYENTVNEFNALDPVMKWKHTVLRRTICQDHLPRGRTSVSPEALVYSRCDVICVNKGVLGWAGCLFWILKVCLRFDPWRVEIGRRGTYGGTPSCRWTVTSRDWDGGRPTATFWWNLQRVELQKLCGLTAEEEVFVHTAVFICYELDRHILFKTICLIITRASLTAHEENNHSALTCSVQ